jgi:catalase-peroxidase
MGKTDVAGTAATVREVFGRMGWAGRELVALIGGGHTFGKAHGASKQSNGVPPNVCPFASWDGPTGTDAITSGFEGPWTDNPVKWGNDYFKYLVEFEWEAHTGPGGNVQWKIIVNETNAADIPRAPTANPKETDKKQDVMMLTTDIAMKFDPEYSQYIHEFATNETAFREAFADAWYKLVTRDVGPISRCVGPVSFVLYVFYFNIMLIRSRHLSNVFSFLLPCTITSAYRTSKFSRIITSSTKKISRHVRSAT